MGPDETRRRRARWRVARWASLLCASLLGALSAVACIGLGDVVDLVSDTYVCGNGKVEPYEDCEDGNDKRGDGCNSNCEVELGWVCSARQHCKRKKPRIVAPEVAPDGGAPSDAGGDAALLDAAR
jgi:cysteine-rich repeat protein